MTINRFLTLAGATAIGLTMAGTANALVIDDVGLGFGTFIGTWGVDNSPGTDDMPNPEGGAGTNAALVGAAINAQYNPDLFNIDEFRFAGGTTGSTTGTNAYPLTSDAGFQIVEFLPSDGDKTVAKWTYSGFPGASQAEIDAGTSPGMAPVDLFIAFKYGDYVSIFRFDIVNPGEFGYLSSDYQEILAHTPDPDINTLVNEDWVSLNYDLFTSTDIQGGDYSGCQIIRERSNVLYTPFSGPNEFSLDCMAKSHGISHVVGYWPPIGDVVVPEPASMTLLGAGLVGLGYFGRRRKTA